ncbi:LOW QUALITY PROTEIN: isocitrate dehydrogenase [NAD] subunit gamma, mitochondrial-like [Sagmatias obliquidens]|uniref:LOW QUALITY PROTEIN: isocitrate dehydrogenase [NAD] subunit gamma, mitochondrial-like n=1 Tax=Sagmatias obliquidens TaxID=3371155 RepID=UPI000F43F1B4|nr:LOW QUALITY PROTEIN: isocitrate dehydrogenase [NAD] subunit gamma, mitochondrial-like [Lagenorhynchus obliquidens]
MALKMLTAARCSVKATFPPTILGHSWEIFLGHETSLRSFSFKHNIPPAAKYGGWHTVTMIPGDGIGPELMLCNKNVFRHVCVPVDFEEVQITSTSSEEEEVRSAIMAVHQNHVALKGNFETDYSLPPSHKSQNSVFRSTLDLYVSVIRFKSLLGVETRHKTSEGEYSNLEHENVKGVIESLKIIPKAKLLHVVEYAFQLVQQMGCEKVTAVHKANIMKLGDGLFLQCCREVASCYPQLIFEGMIVDNTTMQLVSWPQQSDVMVMPSLYGNIVNNVCTELVGGAGLVPSANYGHIYAVFEMASRQSGKTITNKNVANPTAVLLASCIILDYLKFHSSATSIRIAVLASMENKDIQTPDIGGQGTTSDVIQNIIDDISVAC